MTYFCCYQNYGYKDTKYFLCRIFFGRNIFLENKKERTDRTNRTDKGNRADKDNRTNRTDKTDKKKIITMQRHYFAS